MIPPFPMIYKLEEGPMLRVFTFCYTTVYITISISRRHEYRYPLVPKTCFTAVNF